MPGIMLSHTKHTRFSCFK